MRAVVITGAGRGFSAGQDLREFSELQESLERCARGDLPPEHQADPRRSRSRSSQPSTGRSREQGSHSRVACDVRVASSAAAFVPGFVGIGLVPDSGGTWFLHRLLGFARAFEWMCSNRRLDAEEALAWGLVSEVIPADEFEARVAEIAATWAAMPTQAVGMTKQLFDHAGTASLEEQLALEARAAAGRRRNGRLRRRSRRLPREAASQLHRRLSGTGPLRKEP